MLLSVILFAGSCKKKDKDTTPVVKNTYANSRVKQVDKNGNKYLEFTYDNKNKLTSQKVYNTNANPGTIAVSTKDYQYDTNGKLTKETFINVSIPNFKFIIDYTYDNGILKSYKKSLLNTTDPLNIVTIEATSLFYTYNADNRVSQEVIKDVALVVQYTYTYTYTTALNGHPQVNIVFQVPGQPASTTTNTYYPNIINPDPLANLPGIPVASSFLIESQTIVPGNNNYKAVYTSDADGKVMTYATTYANVSNNVTYAYIYEPKQ